MSGEGDGGEASTALPLDQEVSQGTLGAGADVPAEQDAEVLQAQPGDVEITQRERVSVSKAVIHGAEEQSSRTLGERFKHEAAEDREKDPEAVAGIAAGTAEADDSEAKPTTGPPSPAGSQEARQNAPVEISALASRPLGRAILSGVGSKSGKKAKALWTSIRDATTEDGGGQSAADLVSKVWPGVAVSEKSDVKSSPPNKVSDCRGDDTPAHPMACSLTLCEVHHPGPYDTAGRIWE